MRKLMRRFDFWLLTVILAVGATPAQAQSAEGLEPLKKLGLIVLDALALFVIVLQIVPKMIANFGKMDEDPTAKNRFYIQLIAVVGVLSIGIIINWLILKARESGLTGFEDLIPSN